MPAEPAFLTDLHLWIVNGRCIEKSFAAFFMRIG